MEGLIRGQLGLQHGLEDQPCGLRPLSAHRLQERPRGGRGDVKARLAHVAQAPPGALHVALAAMRMDHGGIGEAIGLQLAHRHGHEEVLRFQSVALLGTSEDGGAETHDVGLHAVFAHLLQQLQGSERVPRARTRMERCAVHLRGAQPISFMITVTIAILEVL